MKYIRTKDGIRKIVGENHILKSVSYYNTRGHLCSYRTETNRYKIADTIEELCDYFIYNEYNEDNSESGKLIFKKIFHRYEKEQLKSIMLDGGGNIKLGILKEEGLIYVAKMKGVLQNGEIDWELL